MPTSAVSPEIRTHSWSFVYFRSVGYGIGSALTRAFVERQGDDDRRGGAPADVHVHCRTGNRQRRRHVGHRNGLLQKRSMRAARDDTNRGAVLEHRVAVTGNAAVLELETDQRALRAGGLLRPQ